jgi:hypothetical protein
MSSTGIKQGFEDYILSNKSLLRSKYTMPHIVYKNRLRNPVGSVEIKPKAEIISSWSKVVSSYFSDLNLSDGFIEKICLYCEVIKDFQELNNSLYPEYISSELIDLRKKILEKKSRSKIVDKYYNYTNGKVEYLLENGEYVEIEEKVIRPINDVDMSILPIELLSILDDNEYRNKKIDQII